MISIAGLHKSYGRITVLHGVDIDVPAGSAVALWGPNGAGKTTVLLSVLGFLAIDGRIEVCGHDVVRAGKEARSLIGYVPQRPTFYDDLTVAQNLHFSASLRRIDRAAVETVLESTAMTAIAGTATGALSGGMRQRLALAVALLADPPVLLLDEPLANLDVAARAATITLLQGLRRPDRSMLITSHHLEEVSLLADRVVLMESGRVVDDCAPAELPGRLGLRTWLHLGMAPGAVPVAIAELRRLGHDPSPNGHGVLVALAPAEKAPTLAALVGAGITVEDLEVWR